MSSDSLYTLCLGLKLESDHRHYDLKAIIEIIMGLRVLYPPQNNLTSLRPDKQQQLLPVSSSQARSVLDQNAHSQHSQRSGGSKVSSGSNSDHRQKQNGVPNGSSPAPFIVQSPDQRAQACFMVKLQALCLMLSH